MVIGIHFGLEGKDYGGAFGDIHQWDGRGTLGPPGMGSNTRSGGVLGLPSSTSIN